MATCFIIQPFDRGPFDKRYDEVLVPAVRAADLEPYRVDRDPAAVIPVEDIANGIRSAVACLADISEPNQNVWFEVGFAIASGKPIVLVSREKPDHRYPFDVQHRAIITYRTESVSDFDALKTQIAERLLAAITKERRLETIAEASVTAKVAGLSSLEMVALATIAENADSPYSPVPTYAIRQDMEKQGFTRLAVTLALGNLLRKKMVETRREEDDYRNVTVTFSITPQGMDWLISNQDELFLKESSEQPPMEPISDDDIPF